VPNMCFRDFGYSQTDKNYVNSQAQGVLKLQ